MNIKERIWDLACFVCDHIVIFAAISRHLIVWGFIAAAIFGFFALFVILPWFWAIICAGFSAIGVALAWFVDFCESRDYPYPYPPAGDSTDWD